MAQRWLDRRLAGLNPTSFGRDAKFVSGNNLVPATSFQHAWFSLVAGPVVNFHDINSASELLLFANPCSEAEMRLIADFLERLTHPGMEDVPPVIFVPHTVEPGARPVGFDAACDRVVLAIMNLGVDGFVRDEHEGLRLALEARQATMRATHLAQLALQELEHQRQLTAQGRQLQESINSLLFGYLRNRIAPGIPPVDPTLPPGMPTVLGGVRVGRQLGKGATGAVHELQGNAGVVKVMPKAAARDIPDLQCLNRMINVMRLLSSECWRHPNIVQLYQIYHSKTHFSFCMEHGGPENLYRRLLSRTKPNSSGELRPLSCEKVLSIVTQALAAVSHLHLGPRVCHRDLKPENFILADAPEALKLKLADFNFAAVCGRGKELCSAFCGTPPFIAPEVVLANAYDGFAADIWSLGVVLLEVFCGLRCLDQAVKLPEMTPGTNQRSVALASAQRIVAYFEQQGAAERLFASAVLPELRDVSGSCGPLISHALKVSVQDRCTSSQLRTKQAQVEAL